MLRWLPLIALAVILPALLVGDQARSGSAFNGDLQTGTFAGWSVQDTFTMGLFSVGSHTTYTIIQPAGAPLRYVGDSHVFADSTGNPHQKSRAELLASSANTAAVTGSTSTFDWWFMLPASGNSCAPSWQLLTQLATGAAYNEPNLQVTRARHLELDTASGASGGPSNASHDDLGPVVWGHWYHAVETILWGRSSGSGHVTFTLDGVTRLNAARQTQPSDGKPQAWKLGVYQHDQGCSGEEYVTGAKRY